MMCYEDIYISLAAALAEFESLTNNNDCVIFVSRDLYKKACVTIREFILYSTDSITTFCGRPVEVVDCPGDKLWVGLKFPVKEKT